MMSLVAHNRYSDEGVVECDEELLLNNGSSSRGRRHSAHHKTPHEVRERISLDGITPVHPDKSVSHTHKSFLLPVIHPGSHKETRNEAEEGEDNARRDRGQTITTATIAKKKKGEEATVLSKRERAAIAEQLRVTEAEQHRDGPPPRPPPPAPSAKDKENAKLHERRADPDYALHHRRQRHTRRSLSGEMGCSHSSFGTAANRILRRRLSAAANRVDVLPPPTRPFGEAARSVTLRRRRPRRASQEGVSVSSSSSSLSGHYDRSSMSSSSLSSTSSAYWSRPWEDAMSTGSHSIEHVEEQEYIESMKQEELMNKKEEEEEEEDEVVVLDRVEAKASLDNSTISLTPRVSFGWQDTSEKRDVKDEGKMTAQPAKSVSSASARKASAQSAPVLSATALMTKSASRGSGEAALPVVTRHASLQSNGSNVSSTGQGGGSSGSLASSNNSQYNAYGSFLYGNGSANAITATTTTMTTKAAEGIARAGIPQPPRLLYETRSNSSHSSNNGSGMGLGSPRDSAASLSWLMYSARSSTYSSTSSNSGSGSGGGSSKEPNMNGGIAAGSSEEDIDGSSSNSNNNKMVGNGKGQQQQQHATSARTTHLAEKTASPPLLKPHEERLTLPMLRAVRPLSQPSTTRAADESKAEEAGPVKLHHSSAAVSSIAVDRPQTTLHTTTTTTPSHTQCHLGQRTVEWSSSSSAGHDKLPNGVTRPNSATSQRTGRRMNRRVSFIGEIR